MGLFQRIKDLVSANLNELVSRAENPEVMLNQYIEEARTELKNFNVQVNQAVADQLQLEAKIKSTREAIENWSKHATVAVQQGKDDLARQALEKKLNYEKELAEYEKQLEEQKGIVTQLRENYDALAEKLDQAKAQRDNLVMRQRRAQAQKKANEIVGRMSQTSAFENIDRMAEKVERIEVEAKAASLTAQSSLDEKFKDLEDEAGKSEVEEELRKLKEAQGR